MCTAPGDAGWTGLPLRRFYPLFQFPSDIVDLDDNSCVSAVFAAGQTAIRNSNVQRQVVVRVSGSIHRKGLNCVCSE
jgi:hypothetical protein